MIEYGNGHSTEGSKEPQSTTPEDAISKWASSTTPSSLSDLRETASIINKMQGADLEAYIANCFSSSDKAGSDVGLMEWAKQVTKELTAHQEQEAAYKEEQKKFDADGAQVKEPRFDQLKSPVQIAERIRQNGLTPEILDTMRNCVSCEKSRLRKVDEDHGIVSPNGYPGLDRALIKQINIALGGRPHLQIDVITNDAPGAANFQGPRSIPYHMYVSLVDGQAKSRHPLHDGHIAYYPGQKNTEP